MNRRRGFALAAVLAVLVLMAMSLAVAAQRALVASHRAALAEADAEVNAAAAGAQAAIAAADGAPVDTLWTPGVVLAFGEVQAGLAVASWQVTQVSSALALAEVTTARPVQGVVARRRQSAILAIAADSTGGRQYRVLAPGGWVVLPSP